MIKSDHKIVDFRFGLELSKIPRKTQDYNLYDWKQTVQARRDLRTQRFSTTVGLNAFLLEDLCKHKHRAQNTEPQLQQRKLTILSRSEY